MLLSGHSGDSRRFAGPVHTIYQGSTSAYDLPKISEWAYRAGQVWVILASKMIIGPGHAAAWKYDFPVAAPPPGASYYTFT
jgi:hypothetical protein